MVMIRSKALALALASIATVQVHAQGVISDGDISLEVNAITPNGLTLDTHGIGSGDQLAQLGLWYRLPGGSQEYSFTSTAPDTQVGWGGNFAVLSWSDVPGPGNFEVNLTVVVEDLVDRKTIKYWVDVLPGAGGGSLGPLNVFTFVDPTLDGTQQGDLARRRVPNSDWQARVYSARTCMDNYTYQLGGPIQFNGPYPYRIDTGPNLLATLNDASVTQYENTGLPTSSAGDVAISRNIDPRFGTGFVRYGGRLEFLDSCTLGPGENGSPVPVPVLDRLAVLILSVLMVWLGYGYLRRRAKL